MLFTEKMLTLDEAAKLMPVPGGCSKSSLYRWWRDGYHGVKLECRRVGRGLFTSLEAVERFAAKLGESGANVPAKTHVEHEPTAAAPVTRVSVPLATVERKPRRPAFDAQGILERAGILSLTHA